MKCRSLWVRRTSKTFRRDSRKGSPSHFLVNDALGSRVYKKLPLKKKIAGEVGVRSDNLHCSLSFYVKRFTQTASISSFASLLIMNPSANNFAESQLQFCCWLSLASDVVLDDGCWCLIDGILHQQKLRTSVVATVTTALFYPIYRRELCSHRVFAFISCHKFYKKNWRPCWVRLAKYLEPYNGQYIYKNDIRMKLASVLDQSRVTKKNTQ